MAKRIVRRKKAVASQRSPKFLSNKINLTDKSYTPILLVLLLIAAFLIGALYTKLSYLEKNQTGNPQTGSSKTLPIQPPSPGAKVNIDNGHLPILGRKDAKITVIEFADFQCPFCKRWFQDVKPSLVKDYVNTGKVKLAFRHYAFLGQESTWAAEASECANEQGKFWEYHDHLYNNQGAENSGAFAKDKLIGFARSLNLNTEQFTSCINADKYSKNVSDDLSAGQKAGVTGTPSVFINGRIIVGAQPYTIFKALIDEELKKLK